MLAYGEEMHDHTSTSSLKAFFYFVTLFASIIVAVIVSQTATVDFNGTCLYDARVSEGDRSQCIYTCPTEGLACQGNRGICTNGTCALFGPTVCLTVSEGNDQSKCTYPIVVSAFGMLISLPLMCFYMYSAFHNRTPAVEFYFLLMYILMLILSIASAAVLTQGRESLCDSLSGIGASCSNPYYSGVYASGHTLPVNFYTAMEISIIAAWLAVIAWVALLLMFLVRLWRSHRRFQQMSRLPVIAVPSVTYSNPNANPGSSVNTH